MKRHSFTTIIGDHKVSANYKQFSIKTPILSNPISLAQNVIISQSGSIVSVELPFPLLDSIFYRFELGILSLSTDLRLLIRENDLIDDLGIISLLILGACVPPITPYKSIRTFLPGFSYHIDLKSATIETKPICKWSPLSKKDKHLEIKEQTHIFENVIDQTLSSLCQKESPILLFSGGVDSSILASRLVALGFSETILAHCSFSEHDPETQVAKSVASKLGLNINVIPWDIDKGFEVLEKAASLYPWPFADHSCVPTHGLSKAVASHYSGNRIILDGTGADGCFGLWKKSKQSNTLYRIPSFIRYFLGSFYKHFEMWKNINSLEFIIRLCRKSSVLSELPFLISQNPLQDIAFYMDKPIGNTLSRYCQNWIYSISQTHDIDETYPLLDIGLICAGIYAQKNLSTLRKYSFDVKYPFLEHNIVDLALSHSRFWSGNKVPKNVLKHSLAASIPSKYIYRTKSGFVAPLDEQFSHPCFLGHLEEILCPTSPLFKYINKKFIQKAIGLLYAKNPLPLPTYNFLWAVAFCNAWLTQVPSKRNS